MNAIFRKLVFLLCVCISTNSFASDADDATSSASRILKKLQSNSFGDLWDNDTSAWFKVKMTRASFLANMSLGRAQLGPVLAPSEFIDMAYAKSDPTVSFVGEIYAFTFLSTYQAGRFYEKVVVIKDPDGTFRLSGIFGAPAGK